MQLLITNTDSTTEYAIIDFNNQTWFCPKDFSHSWISYESLCTAIYSGEFIADKIVSEESPYMDEFSSVTAFIEAINNDPDCIDIVGYCEISSLSDLENYIELTI